MRVTPQCDSINSFVIFQNDSVQGNPALDFDGVNYVVAWNDNTEGLNRIHAARVTPGGVVLDAGNHIGAAGTDEQYPDIIFNGAEYFAVWCHYSAPYGVSGRRVGTNAQPIDTVITIALTTTYKYMNPKLAFDSNNYLVVWCDMVTATNFDIYGQRIAPNGSLIGGRITISDDQSSEVEPYVVFDGTKFLVAWNDSGAIVGRYVNTQGQVVGPTFPISATTARPRSYPWIAASNTNFLVVWEEMVSYKDIYGNVDLAIGVEEKEADTSPLHDLFPTIVSGQITLPPDKVCVIYDITGRVVIPDHIKPGVYFVEIDGGIRSKFIKVK